jgi:rubrerythrin
MPTPRKRTVAEHTLEASHSGHAQHLCELVANRKMDMVADLAQGARYICNICGRAAAKAENLCEPVEI